LPLLRRFRRRFARVFVAEFPLSSAGKQLDQGPLDLEPGAPLEEMRPFDCMTDRDRVRMPWFLLAAQSGGLGPLRALAQSPALHNLSMRGYRWIARSRYWITLHVICRRGDDARAGCADLFCRAWRF